MLVLFALQSIKARPRSWIVASLAAGMAALLTLGFTLVSSIHTGTRRSLIESGAGDLQVYHSGSEERPQVKGGPRGELLPLPDYAALEGLLRGVEGVREVVPMEAGYTSVFRGNYLDDKFSEVRTLVREPATPERRARLERVAEDLQRTLQRAARDARQRSEAFASGPESLEAERALQEATSEAFWKRFVEEPAPALEFLENHVARQAGEGESFFFDYLGTDLPLFARSFARFELVTGSLPPPGTRGILLGHGVYEQSFKLRIAARLDELKRERERGGTFAGDERLRTLVERNQAEVPDLLARLDVERATALRAALARVLGHEGELEPLLTEFLKLDDANFDTRHTLFYGELAPHLPLYRVRPGDSLSLKSGAGRSVSVKVWGTYRFRGLGGDFSQVNTSSLMDLLTARGLAGRLTAAQEEEARKLVKSMGLDNVVQDMASLDFVPPEVVELEAETGPVAEPPVFRRDELEPPPTFTEAALKEDVLHAALLLQPGAAPEAVAERIRQLATERKLPLATANWREVGGFAGGVVGLTQVLLVALSLLLGLFVFLVATGTLLLLARERVSEVGTLRAVGMQRRQVMSGLLLEGALLGAVGSALGIALGVALLVLGAGQGIPVQDVVLQFFLGGPVLYLELQPGNLVTVEVLCLVLVTAAAFVPAWRGSAVTPRVAMGQREV
jgi:ABC-type lipoprotein release transport system permease subunit